MFKARYKLNVRNRDGPPCCLPFLVRHFLAFIFSALVFFILPVSPLLYADNADQDLEYYFSEVQTDTSYLHDSLYTIKKDERIYVEWEEILDALGFSIQKKEENYSGYSFNALYSFLWDTENHQVYIGKDPPISVDKADFILEDDLLFVSLEALNEWFSLNAEFDQLSQLILLAPEQKILVEQKLARDYLKTTLNSAFSEEIDTKYYPDIYHLFTSPLIDINTKTNLSQSDELQISANASVLLSMDILYHSAQLSLNQDIASGDMLTSLKLSKQFVDYGSSDYIDTKFYEFGDINANSSSLIGASGNVLGAKFIKGLQSHIDRKTTIVIDGKTDPDYEVELYKGTSLIDIATADGNGEYAFEDVQLATGKNIFTLKIFGPNGEARIETREFYGGGKELAPGHFTVETQVFDTSKGFLRQVQPSSSITYDGYSIASNFGVIDGVNLGVEAFSINEILPIDFLGDEDTVNSQLLDLEPRQLYSFSSRIVTPLGLINTQLMEASDSSSAMQANILSEIFNHSIQFNYSSYSDNYRRPGSISFGRTNKSYNFSTGQVLNHKILQSYAFSLQSNLDHSGEVTNKIGSNFGFRFKNVSSNYKLNLRNSSRNSNNDIQSEFNISGRIKKYRIRASIGSDISNQEFLDSAALSAAWQLKRGWKNNTSLTLSGESANILNTLSIKNEYGIFGSTIALNNNGRINVSLNYSASLFFNDEFKDPKIHNENLSRKGRVEFLYFMDENNNGVFDQDEEIFSDVNFLDKRIATTSRGSFLNRNVSGSGLYFLKANDAIVEDPFVTAKRQNIGLYTHPASHVLIPIPLSLTSHIEGYVFLNSAEDKVKEKPGYGASLGVYDSDGLLIQKGTVEFDGYFAIEAIPVGNYTLKITDKRSSKAYEVPFSIELWGDYVELPEIYLDTLTPVAPSTQKDVTLQVDQNDSLKKADEVILPQKLDSKKKHDSPNEAEVLVVPQAPVSRKQHVSPNETEALVVPQKLDSSKQHNLSGDTEAVIVSPRFNGMQKHVSPNEEETVIVPPKFNGRKKHVSPNEAEAVIVPPKFNGTQKHVSPNKAEAVIVPPKFNGRKNSEGGNP